MGKNSRKIKLFKEVITKDICNLDIKIEDIKIEDIKKYKEQTEKVLNSFIDCDENSLKDIELCKKFNKIDWNLLHNLYFITLNSNEIQQDLVERSKNNRNNILVKNEHKMHETPDLMGLGILLNNPMFKGMIDRVLPVVEKAFEGKDLSTLNINDLMTGIITKDSEKLGGVDINLLLNDSMKVLKNEN